MAGDDGDLMALLRSRRGRRGASRPSEEGQGVLVPPVAPAPPPAPPGEHEPVQAQAAPPGHAPADQEPDLVQVTVAVADSDRDGDDRDFTPARRRRGKAAGALDSEVPDASVGVDRLLTPGLERGVLQRQGEVSEVQRWEAIKQHLTAAGPDIRWRAVGWVMQQEIDHARRVVGEVRSARRGRPAEPRRADAIETAVQQFERSVGYLERALSAVLPDMSVLTPAVNALDRARIGMEHARRGLQAVVGGSSWAAGWEGCAQGRGVPGYDDPEGVARAVRAQRQAHERWKAQRGSRQEAEDPLTTRRLQVVSEPSEPERVLFE